MLNLKWLVAVKIVHYNWLLIQTGSFGQTHFSASVEPFFGFSVVGNGFRFSQPSTLELCLQLSLFGFTSHKTCASNFLRNRSMGGQKINR